MEQGTRAARSGSAHAADHVLANRAAEVAQHPPHSRRESFRHVFGIGVAAHVGSALVLYATSETILSATGRRDYTFTSEDYDFIVAFSGGAVALFATTAETQIATGLTVFAARQEARARGLALAPQSYARAWAGHLLGRVAGIFVAFAAVRPAETIVTRAYYHQDPSAEPRNTRAVLARSDAIIYLLPAIVRSVVGSVLAASFVDRAVSEGPVVARRRRVILLPPAPAATRGGFLISFGGVF